MEQVTNLAARKRVLHLPENLLGNDYALGDIHGAFGLVWAAMKAVNFNPEVDRLLMVGDYIDRGPESARALKFLKLPYVFGVAGNHDRALVEAWKEGHLNRDVIDALARMNYNGMRWMATASIEFLEELAATMDELPFAMDVRTKRGLIGLVHADVPAGMDWQTFVEKIDAGDPYATRMALGMDLTDFHESRQRILNSCKDGIKGIGRVFVGHTPQFEGMRVLSNLVAVDSGAIFGQVGKEKGHLTVVNPLMNTAYLNTPQPRQDNLLDLRVSGDIPDRSFSALQPDVDVDAAPAAPAM